MFEIYISVMAYLFIGIKFAEQVNVTNGQALAVTVLFWPIKLIIALLKGGQ